MFYENEVVMFILGLGVLAFILGNRSRLKRFPAFNILIPAFYLLLAGWGFTILEGLFWHDFFNLLEHGCYAFSSILLTVCCFTCLRAEEGVR